MTEQRILLNVELMRSPFESAVAIVSPGKPQSIQIRDEGAQVHTFMVEARPLVTGPPGEWLKDARGVVKDHFRPLAWSDDGTTRLFEYDMIPSARPLHAVLTEAVQHGADNPTHGSDCACMDEFSRELYIHLLRAVPEHPKDNTGAEYDRYSDARRRATVLLQRLTRNL